MDATDVIVDPKVNFRRHPPFRASAPSWFVEPIYLILGFSSGSCSKISSAA